MDLYLSAKCFVGRVFLFCPGSSETWTKSGYKNMRGFFSDCKKHENAKSHLNAFKTWKVFSAREARDLRVDVMFFPGEKRGNQAPQRRGKAK